MHTIKSVHRITSEQAVAYESGRTTFLGSIFPTIFPRIYLRKFQKRYMRYLEFMNKVEAYNAEIANQEARQNILKAIKWKSPGITPGPFYVPTTWKIIVQKPWSANQT